MGEGEGEGDGGGGGWRVGGRRTGMEVGRRRERGMEMVMEGWREMRIGERDGSRREDEGKRGVEG